MRFHFPHRSQRYSRPGLLEPVQNRTRKTRALSEGRCSTSFLLRNCQARLLTLLRIGNSSVLLRTFRMGPNQDCRSGIELENVFYHPIKRMSMDKKAGPKNRQTKSVNPKEGQHRSLCLNPVPNPVQFVLSWNYSLISGRPVS
jgi:hypothetical protein